jgi:steroid 5-alpha reductase family enzyme
MGFFQIYLINLAVIISLMTVLWVVSIKLANVSIVDSFWGLGFVLSLMVYYFFSEASGLRSWILLAMVFLWGFRLSVYLTLRNWGKGEDFRYKEFRRKYGAENYWWISFFQTFLLQGFLMWLISAPLLGALFNSKSSQPGALEVLGLLVWLIGFCFEAGGDWQLSRFKSNPGNKGKVLDKGFWRYTRHPNYFGDAAVWWGYGIFSISVGSYIAALGSLLMTALILKVSGVVLLEKSLNRDKPAYAGYVRKTAPFIPWFPKKM